MNEKQTHTIPVRMGEELCNLVEEYTRCQEQSFKAGKDQRPSEKQYWEDQAERVYACKIATEFALSGRPANDLVDCLAQLVIMGRFIEDERDDFTNAAHRIIRSVVGALERETGVDRERFAGDYYLPRRFDTFPLGRELE